MTDKDALGPAPLVGDRYGAEDGQVYLSGLQALVRLPIDQRRADRRAGLDTAMFIAGYEGSPLAGYDLELQRQSHWMRDLEIVFEPGLNEELAANAVQGSQLASVQPTRRHDGVTGIWYGKAPGLDRATDAIRHANLGGTSRHGGVLALVGDDATAKSSSIPSGSELALAELSIPTLYPADPQEALDFGLHGIALSRVSGLWSALKIATVVADGSRDILVGPDRVRPVEPHREFDGQPFEHVVSAYFLQPKLAELEQTMLHQRLELARRYAVVNRLNVISRQSPGDRLGIVAAGSTYLDLMQALTLLGLDADSLATLGIRVLKLGMIFPIEPSVIDNFAADLDEIIVVEEKRGFVEGFFKQHLYGRSNSPKVVGKVTENGAALFREDGELTPDLIAAALRDRFTVRFGASIRLPRLPVPVATRQPTRVPLKLATRTPFFCSGCPHNRSLETSPDSLVGAGIGCAGMALLMPAERVGNIIGLTQMGGEGAPWIGMSPFVDAKHLTQNIGDGTFHHSGSLSVRAAIAAKQNITFKILYNSAVAMTGGQQAVGGMSVAELTRMLAAEGVRQTVVTTDNLARYKRVRLAENVVVKHRDQLVQVQADLAAVPGVTVLIHDQECATELRRKRKRDKAAEPTQRAFINQRACEGCGDCGTKSNCLSVQPVQTEFGRKTQIHQQSCNKDYSCLDGDCPSFLTVVPAPAKATHPKAPVVDVAALPEPTAAVSAHDYAMRIAGIGGTGIVTVAQIIATAAVLAGNHVRALDQVGLAQKGGAVISDIKIADRPLTESHRIGIGGCDLYLGCDALVAAAEKNLEVASPERTVAVVSTTPVPTGAMVIDPTVASPSVDDTKRPIEAASRSDPTYFADAQHLTRELLGNEQYANVLLLGVAYQLGAVPIAAEYIETAIERNGAAVAWNIAAFRYGRLQVGGAQSGSDRNGRAATSSFTTRASTRASTTASTAAPSADAVDLVRQTCAEAAPEVQELVARLVEELTRYQDVSYARRYAELVGRTLRAECALPSRHDGRNDLPGPALNLPPSDALTQAVARNLFKLMAYKDEFEVARLSLDPQLQADLNQTFGPGARYRYRLHPPVLRALGMKGKISLGPWFRHVFSVLYVLRFLRGHWYNPFGWGQVRRTERALIDEYRSVIIWLLTTVTSQTLPLAVRIAELPDLVRGYEHIKLANVDRYHSELTALTDEYERASVPEPTPSAA